MKNNIWNIILTAIATGFLGLLGYLLLNMVNLQSSQHTIEATVFTKEDSAVLRQQLTDVMNDIDTRIQLLERDISWIKPGTSFSAMMGPMPDPPPLKEGGELGADEVPAAPLPLPQMQQQMPRYDLRDKK